MEEVKNQKRFRIERDSMGEIEVEVDRLWGAQTQRSLENFRIGKETMPKEVIRAFAFLKKATAMANLELGALDEYRTPAIMEACDEILEGTWDDQFPLVVWQTGSGTQTNMNVNEVVAHRGNQILGESSIHPNDHVNRSQSSNDTFPSAMHIAVVLETEQRLLPAVEVLADTLGALSKEYMDIVKIGRTHLQDAVPITLGQEISGWEAMLRQDAAMIRSLLDQVRELALGGTAVGTGLNADPEFGAIAARHITELTGTTFITAPNKFQALTSKAGMVALHGTLKALAADLYKIANDVRLLASGPRCGIGEISIPENEPGSSIMPGKVNPTQSEALTMVCCQVMANDTAVGFGASQGHFQLNVYLPLIAYNVLQSIGLLVDAMDSFRENCVVGIRPNLEKINENLNRSLMLVTALNPYIGYDKAAKIAKQAFQKGTTLKEEVLNEGLMTEEEFDRIVDPKLMV
ncbi:MAG: class II fumarate hydratase [Firmicutes bacterium HGW-Firmicutes-11]|jgi:fumarate hydratase class II|nr:MAG: class II fumarate hydratase [Firmicutes bacterium HGW-Firmicutes-11]